MTPGNSTTYLKIPMGNDINDLKLNCSSFADSTNNDIHWYYNGNILGINTSPVHSLLVSSSNFTNVFGIYQCFLANSSVSAIYTFRVLPFGKTQLMPLICDV